MSFGCPVPISYLDILPLRQSTDLLHDLVRHDQDTMGVEWVYSSEYSGRSGVFTTHSGRTEPEPYLNTN